MRAFATVAFFVAAVGLSQSSNVQTGAASQKPPQGDVCWQNAATGQSVPNGNLVPNGTTQDPTDPDRASRGSSTPEANPATGAATPATNNYVRVPCTPSTQTTTPPTTPGTTGMGFAPTIQLRGFGGATFVNSNAPSTAGFDGAVLFPLGNRVLVGPTAGFQWVDSSIVQTIGSQQPGSTFIHTSVGFKNGNFGGRIAFPLGGWQLGIQGGATVAGSTITQAEGFCGLGNTTSPAGCTVTSTTTSHDTVVSPFVGGYISHSIFSHVGVFVEYDYHRLKDTQSSATVFDLHSNDVVAGLVLSFGRHKAK